MTINLGTTKYNDGTPIPNVPESIEWRGLTDGAYCGSTYSVYGFYYNWYAVSTGHLCPTGWHVPSDNEWKILEMYLGMTQEQVDSIGQRGTDQGLQLKTSSDWFCQSRSDCELNPDQGGTNSSGFSAIPNGYRWYSGGYEHLGNPASWWTSSEENTLFAWARGVSGQWTNVSRGANDKHFGFGIRCIKD